MIHQYKLNGYNIVLDVYSASVHVTDDLAYDGIHLIDSGMSEDAAKEELHRLHPEATEEELTDTFADIHELTEQGKLFTKDVYEKAAGYLKKQSTVVKALCLLVAHTCDLNCSYCFASQGKFHGKEGMMTLETAKRAIDFLVENSGNRRNLEVDFFGGEPLLNFELCKETVAYARSIEKEHNKNFRFTLTTNGVKLDDEVIEWANKECYNVVLSLDGRKEVHDRFRVDRAGRGSYDRIVPNFQKFVAARGDKSYYMRGTYSHYNTDFTNDIFHMADDLGFSELSMEPVVTDPSSPSALTEEDLPVLYEQYEILAKDMLRREKDGKPITFYHYMIDLEHGPCVYKRVSGCGSGTEYMAVTAWGDLYPCHQFVNDPEYKLGNIWDGVQHENIRDEFKECNVYSRPECKECWARMYCAGGCAANALHATGDIHGVYEYGCKLFRKRMECALMMKVAEAEMAQEQHEEA
ncbi:MAG TPA: thioether cross-link-forming SCIFF peptide maturase [Oribacterium sp.]|nr:thioether cross-link-forming SCIFF peptide maturase [Oribacterium sp.]HCS67655.1 thioether cross-link-forming SCIFF peptide maturase [Oribacterium sp.]